MHYVFLKHKDLQDIYHVLPRDTWCMSNENLVSIKLFLVEIRDYLG